MFDGEATEQDIDSLLNENHAEISRQLESFHLIQQALHKESKVSVGLQDSLVSRIRAEIDAEDSSSNTTHNSVNNNLITFSDASNMVATAESETSAQQVSKPTWKMMFSSMAIAASVTFVVILGGNTLLTSDTNNLNTIAEIDVPEQVESTVITSLADLNKESLPADNIRLQHYLRQHAEQATMTVGQGMIPMARVVSYPIEE
jgi:sigma-E factor negative regulatory protein RseA